MNNHEKHERVRAMLARYRDALAQGSLGASGEAFDSRVLLFGKDFNDALRELDRCLSKMRNQGSQQVIEGIPLRTIRFHVIAWFVDVHYQQVPVYVRKATKKGWARSLSGYKLEPRRHRDAREPKAELGVQWIAREFAWDAVHLKAITEACGELLAA